jgi:hypothetical protein
MENQVEDWVIGVIREALQIEVGSVECPDNGDIRSLRNGLF